MKNSISKVILAILVLFISINSQAQIKNAITENVKIYGNCGMCKQTIEKAGNVKKVAEIDWNKDTKMATITYNSKKTNKDEILKRIALAGYDSENFLAPDEIYASLMECCQYTRAKDSGDKMAMAGNMKNDMGMMDHSKMNHEKMDSEKMNHSKMNHEKKDSEKMDHSKMNHEKMSENKTSQNSNQLSPVFDNYFAVKDALVSTDGTLASNKAKALLTTMNDVKMGELPMDVHTVWMKVMKNLKADTKQMSETNDIAKQRETFITLSKNMYDLMKVSKTATPTYYQFCPMANNGKGANWLSKENEVKNPYYGSMMLTCGSTKEVIK